MANNIYIIKKESSNITVSDVLTQIKANNIKTSIKFQNQSIEQVLLAQNQSITEITNKEYVTSEELNQKGYLTEYQDLSNYVKKIDGKELSTNDYTNADKQKLNNIEANANKYVHPATHNANMITTDTSHRFITDEEKEKLNNMADNWESESMELAKYGKKVISQAITNKGVSTNNTDTFDTMATNIGKIETSGTIVEGDNIATTYMRNKKILFVGDSFFAGTTGNTPISTLLDNKIETVSTNIAKKGASYISDSTNCINTQLSNYINSNGIDNFDLILLSGGGNDCFFNENLAIGTFVDTETLLASTTVLGQIQRVFEMLKEKDKLKNLLYVLGNYAGDNANGLKNIPLLEAKLLPMLDAYNVPYIYFKDKYTLEDTVNQDGMHPTNTIYNTIVIPLLVPYMIYTYINSISNSNTESGGDTPSSGIVSALCQGSLTANGVKIDIVGKKITFTAQQNISTTNGLMFLVTGDSLLGGTKNSDFSSRLTDTFFGCENRDVVSLELSNIQSTNNKATGYVALASQTGATQVIVYPQSTTFASSTLTAASCGLICAINNMKTGDVASYNITVTKNGVEIGNVIS